MKLEVELKLLVTACAQQKPQSELQQARSVSVEQARKLQQ